MARTFVQTDVASDSGFNVGDTGETASINPADLEMLEGGTPGTVEVLPDIDNDPVDRERATIMFQSDTGGPQPNDASWEAGNYVVNLNVTTSRVGITWRASYLMSRTTGGTYTTRGSLTGQTTSLAAGTQTQTIVLGSAASVNASDTMVILTVFGGQLTHGTSTLGVTPGLNIVTPLNAVSGGVVIPVIMASYRRRHQNI